VANRELWERLIAEMARHRRVTPTLVRGHAGHELNERADRLAQEAATLDHPPAPAPGDPPAADPQPPGGDPAPGPGGQLGLL
jgi:ribonuclease HI